MLKYLIHLFITIIGFPIVVFCQYDFAQIEIPSKNLEKLVVMPDSSGNVCFYYRDLKYHYFTLINSEGEKIRTRTFNRYIMTESDQCSEFMGVTISDSAFIVFMQASNYKEEFISAFRISKLDSFDKKISRVNFDSKKNRIIRYYTDKGTFHLITTNKNSKQLNFHKVLNENQIEVNTFKPDKQLLKLFNKNEFGIIKNTQVYTIPLANPQQKLYVSESGKIIFTLENAKKKKSKYGNTKVFVLNSNTHSIENYFVDCNTQVFNNYCTNSFYHKGKIYKIITNPTLIGLYINDLQTGTCEKKFEYRKKDDIELISDKVITKGENTYFGIWDKEKVLEKKSKIFQNLNNGKPSVAVKLFNTDTLSLLIGSFNVKSSSNVPVMISGNPAYYAFIPIGSDSEYTTWFNSFIKVSNYEIVRDKIEDPEFYKIETYMKFLKGKDIKIENSVVFKIKNKLYFGYIPKSKARLEIVEIL